MQPPCYNTRENVHCPNRSVACHCSCSSWSEYEKYKQQRYAQQERERQYREDAYNGAKKTRILRKEAGRIYG